MIVKKRKEVDEINSSSMADIAFLLLVFFLVTTTIDAGEGVSLILPPANSDPLNKKPDDLVKILVRSTGEVLFAGEVITIKQIEQNAKNKLIEFKSKPKKNGKFQQPIFIVETDTKTKYQDFLNVIDQLKAAECTKISVVKE